MGPCLALSRVLALVGGLALVAAFFMPWFSSQGLLLSGQFLNTFLGSASPADLRRFLPNSSPAELQLLRGLVDLFPACGAIAALASLIGGVTTRGKRAANVIVGLSGGLSLVSWAIGITRLPAGSGYESGLWLIALGSLAVLGGLVIDLGLIMRSARTSSQ